MIFVTVGTHEQQFNRLVENIDKLKEIKLIKEEVMIQTGFCTYKPKYCTWNSLISYSEMVEYVSKARIVITHGGPASFIMPLQIGKIPIVVPRQKKFNEHINNHQIEFTKAVVERNGNIIPVYDIEELKEKILNYNEIISKLNSGRLSNNKNFNKNFQELVKNIFNPNYS